MLGPLVENKHLDFEYWYVTWEWLIYLFSDKMKLSEFMLTNKVGTCFEKNLKLMKEHEKIFLWKIPKRIYLSNYTLSGEVVLYPIDRKYVLDL